MSIAAGARVPDRAVIDLLRLGERRLEAVVRGAQRRLDVRDEAVGLLARQDAFLDQLLLVELAHARVGVDLLDHQRLRVGRFVLLVVPEPAVADEIDHDVLAEAAPVRHREPGGGDRRLGVVGVHVDDRAVEPLREVGRVARRAALARIGREPDLVVRDQVQRAAGRVAVEVVQVERLRDHALPGERRIAVQQHRERDRRVVRAVRRRAVRLLGARAALDDGVDRFEVARVRDEPDADLAARRRARAGGGQVVLDVARAALRVGGDGVDRPLAFELAQDVLVRRADRVREHVEPAAVRHAHDDVVRARLGGELDRLVEHRDHHVEPFDRELLLAEEPLAQEALHPLHLAEAAEERLLLLGGERLPVPAGLDRLPQPHALLVVGEVLELVRDRAAVRLRELRQDVGERLAGNVHAQHRGRDLRLELGRQLRLEAERLERRDRRPAPSRAGRAARRGGRACGAP